MTCVIEIWLPVAIIKYFWPFMPPPLSKVPVYCRSTRLWKLIAFYILLTLKLIAILRRLRLVPTKNNIWYLFIVEHPHFIIKWSRNCFWIKVHIMLRHFSVIMILWSSFIFVRDPSRHSLVDMRRFRIIYGTSHYVVKVLWSRLFRSLHKHCRPLHLLYALLFLKTYGIEHLSAQAESCDEKHFHTSSWFVIELLSRLITVRSP